MHNLDGATKYETDINVTCDTFATEEAAEEWLANFLQSTRQFSVYRQVEGVPVFRHHRQEWKDVRCDILAIPLSISTLNLGSIVFEVKRSGEKIGPPMSQMLDYLHTIFTVRNQIGLVPTMAFLFPCEKQHGAVASLMQQQHMGSARRSYKHGLQCFCGEQRLLEFDSSGNLVYSDNLKSGRKMGSR